MIVCPVIVILVGVKDESAVILTNFDLTVWSFEFLTFEAIQVERKILSIEVAVSLELKEIRLFVLSEATLVNLQIGNNVAGVGTFDLDCVAMLALEVDRFVGGFAVPGWKYECHVTYHIFLDRIQVVGAVSLHNNLFLVAWAISLSQQGLYLPHLLELCVRNELGLDPKRSRCVNQGAIWSVSTLAVLLDAVLIHIVLALWFGITISALTRVDSHLKSVFVCLHDVNARALGLGWHRSLGVASTWNGHGVSASDTSAIGVAEVDLVLNGSTFKERHVGILGSINWSFLHERFLVIGDGHLFETINLNLRALHSAPHPEWVHKVIFLGDDKVKVDSVLDLLSTRNGDCKGSS